MKQAIFNRETLKIELHFDRSEYIALSEAEKGKIKSAFLWSNRGGCWVSRAKEPNLYQAKQIARDLGFGDIEKTGERLSFAEQVEQAKEKAESRADRYEDHADRAADRAKALQKPMNDHHGDIAFFTQPNINSAAGRSFKRYRERVYASFEKGIDEYRKSEYWKDRAATARVTAAAEKYNDPAYLERKIKECKLNLKHMGENLAAYDKVVAKLAAGETVKHYNGTLWTMEEVDSQGADLLERMEAERDKLAYMLDCRESLGGIKFNRDNIKSGYVVNLGRFGKAKVVSVGKVNVDVMLIATGTLLRVSFAEIKEVVQSVEEIVKSKQPFEVGETYTVPVWQGNAFVKTEFKIIKATAASVTLQAGDNKPILRRPTKSRISPDTWILGITDGYNGTVYKKSN